MRKIRILLICVLCMAFTNIAHASEDTQQRYIVKPKENAGVKLFSIKSNDMLPLGDGLYLTNNVSDLKNAEYYFRDHELQMLEADYPTVTSDEQFSIQWHLDSIKSEAAREKGITGNGVKIAVVDSGLNINHQDLNPYNILPGCNCITGALDSHNRGARRMSQTPYLTKSEIKRSFHMKRKMPRP